MRVYVFSKVKRAPLTHGARSAGALTLEVIPLDALARTLPTLPAGCLIYLDMAGLTAKDQLRRISQAAEQPGLLFGILDAAGKVTDPASLFHLGAVDYLGKSLAGTGLTARRVGDVLAFSRVAGKITTSCPEEALPQARGWGDVVEGRKYPFFLLFVEADNAEEMKKRYQPENVTRAMTTFRSYVERAIVGQGGRMWLWQGLGGLTLFPAADGGYPPFVTAFRIMVSRPFFDVEESPLPNSLSFRMALSQGTFVYKEKRTGGIISDALNSIFHLGQKFTEPGRFTLTADVLPHVPDSLREHCVPAGTFEGRKIYRVRAPLYPVGQREGEWARDA